MIFSGFIHVVTTGRISFFMAERYSIGSHTHTHVCIYHIFLSHSFICRNLGCFCILLLWIALQWTLKCRYLFKILSVPLDIYPEVGLPDHMVILFLILWGTSLLVSIATTAVYMPARYKGSLYSASWPTLISYLFDNPNKREVVSHCGFNVPFSAKWCWASFHVPVAPLFIFVRLHILCLYLLFFIFYFIIIIIFLLYNIVLVLPYVNMNLPRVYTCPQCLNWTFCFVFLQSCMSSLSLE